MKQQFIYSALLMLALTGCGKKQAQKNDTEAPNTDSSATAENKEETGTWMLSDRILLRRSTVGYS